MPPVGRDTQYVILFADVVGSTRLYEAFGDDKGRRMVSACLEVMSTATLRQRGRVIKTIGDEIMATFEDANAAMEAAIEMHLAVGGHPQLKNAGQPVMLRIGMHRGTVVLEQLDVFGSAVHTASRVADEAKAGQILFTGPVHQQLGPPWLERSRQVDVEIPRGQTVEVELYEALWQGEEITSMLPSIEAATGRPKSYSMTVGHQGRSLLIDGRTRPVFTVGRDPECDLVVDGTLVSRRHARIEAAKSGFMLVDQSTNGCFIKPEGSRSIHVRRDSIALRGKGRIGLGQAPEADSSHTIEYSCEGNS